MLSGTDVHTEQTVHNAQVQSNSLLTFGRYNLEISKAPGTFQDLRTCMQCRALLKVAHFSIFLVCIEL